MTVRGGGKPRKHGEQAAPGDMAKRKIVDTGWDDYLPPDAQEIAAGKRRDDTDIRRDYRKNRDGGPGSVLRFALFALVLGGLVAGGLYFVVRPIVINGIVGWAAENPTALKLPFVTDIVKGELGPVIDKPVNADDQTAIAIVIAANATPREIAAQLLDAGVINDARAFVFEAIATGSVEKFQIGRHVVSKSMNMDQILKSLTTPPVASPLVRVTFREGLRLEQMVAKLELLEASPVDKTAPLTMDINAFYQLAINPPLDLLAEYPWLRIPEGGSLEGFLYPATYNVAPDIAPRNLLKLLLNAFQDHAPKDLLLLTPEQIYQKVQLASLVELEVKVDTDRALVAGVYTNRLDKKLWPTGLLDADPTLNYAADSIWLSDPANPIETWVGYTFWNPIKTDTTYNKVVFPGKLAPFNTYHYAGLPPWPICSPSAASLTAALHPDTTDGYLYFLAKNDGSGTHAFAKTQAEHNANLKKYGYIK
jgi:UPF0755 protein